MDVQIPDKLYFKIGEVANLTGIKPHVLRYWETEFKTIRPTKSRSKQRLYRKQEIELILRLKDLLYNQGYTISGARRLLRQKPEKVVADIAPTTDELLLPEIDQMSLPLGKNLDSSLVAEIRTDLLRLRKSLDQQP
jgi:DNA-binding transcriptional MerR regulator